MFVVTVLWNTNINLVNKRRSSYYRVLNGTVLNYILLTTVDNFV